MTTMPENQQVSVSAGDLDEALQSATAWAGYLRQREASKDDAARYAATADRIDSACHRLRVAQYEGLRS